MIALVFRKLGWALVVLWAVTSLTFFVNTLLPSDPARMVAGPQARPSDVARIRVQLGLDRSVLEQYGIFMHRLAHVGPVDSFTTASRDSPHATCARIGRVHFDLGKSYLQRRPVLEVLGERAPRSLLLAAAAVLVQALLGVASGTLAAARKGTAIDHLAIGTSMLGISAPTFIIGIALQYVFAHKLGLLPLDGFGRTATEHARCLVLPALTLGLYGTASYTRLTRDEMIGVLRQDYVRTARSKGLSESVVVIKHGVRNALLPIVTILGLDFGALVGGAIVTESLFAWPGIGALTIGAVFDRDGPMIVGAVIVSSSAIVLSNVLVDLAYAALDPRVRAA